MSTVKILHGDCIKLMKKMSDASVDSIVTDPPYGINFMGKAWDGAAIAEAAVSGVDHTKTTGRSASMHAGRYDVSLTGNAAFQVWTEAWAREALRVLKPGGHLLVFGSTRTYHRMACGIEDAGFEIRDSIHWIYGSGFPKSLDVSKAIDKANGRKFEDRYPLAEHIRERRKAGGFTTRDVNGWFGYSTACEHWESKHPESARVPSVADFQVLKERLNLSDEWDELVARVEAEREVVGTRRGVSRPGFAGETYGPDGNLTVEVPVTLAATDEAKRWEGWGTALKPAHEPVVVARKPLVGTVAGNVLEHGTGALNIDGCRVGTGTGETRTYEVSDMLGGNYGQDREAYADREKLTYTSVDKGRWPANVVFDRAAGEALDQQTEGASRFFTQADFGPDDWPFVYQAKPSRKERNAGLDGLEEKITNDITPPGTKGANSPRAGANRNGAAANHHPTVKPIALMRHLVRLVTPPGGVVLDPFAGSGTTLVAAVLEGFDAVGCEMTDEYLPIIRGRIDWAKKQTAKRDKQMKLGETA